MEIEIYIIYQVHYFLLRCISLTDLVQALKVIFYT